MSGTACPARHAHVRLMDCHEQWHITAERYMEPDGFRLSLNALIQSLRNVTWLLQKQKAQLVDFNTWYPAWQQSVADDAVMQWLVKSRNRIVKESDLELLSRATIHHTFDWLNEIRATWTLPPRYNTRSILIRILSSNPYMDEGILTIERSWIDKQLPGRELLSALRHVYGEVARVVATAHHANGVSECDIPARPRACMTATLVSGLLCMEEIDENRRLNIDLANRMEYVNEFVPVVVDEDLKERAVERYGKTTVTGDAIASVRRLVPHVKKMLETDGGLLTVAQLFKGDKVIDLFPMVFADQNSKRLAMHALAERVERRNADGVVFISELWWAEIGSDEDVNDPRILPAGERADRKEAFHVVGFTRDGRYADALVTFSRGNRNEVLFGLELYDVGGQLNLIEPVKRMWANCAPADS